MELLIDPLLDQRWASVADAGPSLIQHWVEMTCLLCGITVCSLCQNSTNQWPKADPDLNQRLRRCNNAGLVLAKCPHRRQCQDVPSTNPLDHPFDVHC